MTTGQGNGQPYRRVVGAFAGCEAVRSSCPVAGHGRKGARRPAPHGGSRGIAGCQADQDATQPVRDFGMHSFLLLTDLLDERELPIARAVAASLVEFHGASIGSV